MAILRNDTDYRFDLLSEQNEDDHIHQDAELLYVLHGQVDVRMETSTFRWWKKIF